MNTFDCDADYMAKIILCGMVSFRDLLKGKSEPRRGRAIEVSEALPASFTWK